MRRRAVAAQTTLLAVLLAVGSPQAQADPLYPSSHDVRRARQHTAVVGDQVSRLQAQLIRATARMTAANVALSAAAEDFDVARIELQDSRQAARAAAEVAARAGNRLTGAQQQVGQLAAQSYRSGGSLASLDVLLSPTGPDQVLERASMMHTLAGQRQHTLHALDAARVVATTLDTQAAEALARQTAAAQRLQRARAVATRQAAAAHSTLLAEQATHAALLTRLAAAEQTTVTLEQARSSGLARAEQARRAQAQRQAAVRLRAKHRAAQPMPGTSAGSSADSGALPGPAPTPTPAPAPTPVPTSGSSGSPSSGSSNGSPSAGQSAVSWAERQIGLPYQWGGFGPGSYDCSGLTMRAWQQAGVGLPHSSRIQYQQVAKISYSELRPGDLLFFATDPGNSATIHHVALYAGGGQMIEAPYTGANVRIVPLRTADAMPYAGRP